MKLPGMKMEKTDISLLLSMLASFEHKHGAPRSGRPPPGTYAVAADLSRLRLSRPQDRPGNLLLDRRAGAHELSRPARFKLKASGRGRPL